MTKELITRTPGIRKAAVFKMIRLIIKVNNPRVNQIRGKRIRRIIGLIKRLRTVRIKAKIKSSMIVPLKKKSFKKEDNIFWQIKMARLFKITPQKSLRKKAPMDLLIVYKKTK